MVPKLDFIVLHHYQFDIRVGGRVYQMAKVELKTPRNAGKTERLSRSVKRLLLSLILEIRQPTLTKYIIYQSDWRFFLNAA